jgi:hypothetical protein
MFDENEYVVCEICGENLGVHQPFFANEHRKKFPSHDAFLVKHKKREGV